MQVLRTQRSVLARIMPVALALIAATNVLLLAGCNTVDGAGKDIEKAGEGIQDAAK